MGWGGNGDEGKEKRSHLPVGQFDAHSFKSCVQEARTSARPRP